VCCLNQLYEGRRHFAICFDNDWSQVDQGQRNEFYHFLTGIPDVIVMSQQESSVIMIKQEVEQGIIELKELPSDDGEGRLFGALLLLAACITLRDLVHDKIPATTLQLKGLLVERNGKNALCKLDANLWGETLKRSTFVIQRGAANKDHLLKLLHHVWPCRLDFQLRNRATYNLQHHRANSLTAV
jgi:hypothetical protein